MTRKRGWLSRLFGGGRSQKEAPDRPRPGATLARVLVQAKGASAPLARDRRAQLGEASPPRGNPPAATVLDTRQEFPDEPRPTLPETGQADARSTEFAAAGQADEACTELESRLPQEDPAPADLQQTASERPTIPVECPEDGVIRPAPEPQPVRRPEGDKPQATSQLSEATLATIDAVPPVAGSPQKIGRFVVHQRLGAGAFGTVYRAHDPVLDREVALKVPHASSLQSETRRARVLTEAKAAAQLRHPNIVPVYEAGHDGDSHYIASAFIEGQTLEDAIEEQKPDLRRAAKLVMDLAGALQYAHQHKVVHRDIKPANIMLDAQGDPLVMDFGLARLEDAESRMTIDGTVLGTPAYMPPEQASGRHDQVGPASDQYSLGVVLYDLLCGQPPFSGPPAMVISLVINQEPPWPRTENAAIPKDLETICLKAMAKAPDRRYESCREMGEDLRRWLADEPIRARRIGPLERLWRWCRRNPLVAALSTVAVVLLLVVAVVSSVAYLRVVKTQRERIMAQVNSLRRAEIAQVPYLLESLNPVYAEITPRLEELLQQPDLTDKEHLRLSLAMLPGDPNQVDYLRRRLLDADPEELLVISRALVPHSDSLVKGLWSIVDDPQSPKDRRFRAACALAAFDPKGPGWKKASQPTAEVLVTENALHVGTWMEALRPVSQRLLPPLEQVFRDDQRPESERSLAAGILADYSADQPEQLSLLLADAETKHFAVLFRRLQAHQQRAISALKAQLAQATSAAADPGAAPSDRDRAAKRRANLAAALMRMGRAEDAWPVLKHSPDPSARSYLVHRIGPLGVEPKTVVTRLDEEQDVSVRRALLLALGEFGEEALPAADRQALTPKLLGIYRDDPDAGIHGAVEWLLRQWGQEKQVRQIERRLAAGKATGKSNWYVTPQGHTMVILRGPVEFLMGSPTSEADRNETEGTETQHLKRIGRSFAVANKAVTQEQYAVFWSPGSRFRRLPASELRRYAPTSDCPEIGVCWYAAAAYCNWLSKREGIPEEQWCYLPNGSGQYAGGMRPAANILGRTGYRLPTEAEWEYACRAGAATSRFYGQTSEMLSKYAGYQQMSLTKRAWPVGSFKPNDSGLFDMQGHVSQWCQDAARPYRLPVSRLKEELVVEDSADTNLVSDRLQRVLRGGSFGNLPRNVRSANRQRDLPVFSSVTNGFRVARTCQ